MVLNFELCSNKERPSICHDIICSFPFYTEEMFNEETPFQSNFKLREMNTGQQHEINFKLLRKNTV